MSTKFENQVVDLPSGEKVTFTRIIGTRIVVGSAWEPTTRSTEGAHSHATITSFDGVDGYFGRVGTKRGSAHWDHEAARGWGLIAQAIRDVPQLHGSGRGVSTLPSGEAEFRLVGEEDGLRPE